MGFGSISLEWGFHRRTSMTFRSPSLRALRSNAAKPRRRPSSAAPERVAGRSCYGREGPESFTPVRAMANDFAQRFRGPAQAALRIAAGAAFFTHGAAKLFGWFGGVGPNGGTVE